MSHHRPFSLRLVPLALTAAILAACGSVTPDDSPGARTAPQYDPSDSTIGKITGNDGLLGVFGGSGRDTTGAANGIGVNAFLWRASLDTVSFMPLSSADPFGGVIITDWFTPPETPNERFKINLYILDRQLRADGIKASVFRQTKTPDGRWVDAAVDPKTTADFENAILTRARQLRVTSAEQKNQ